MTDERGSPIKVGDLLYNKHGYYVTVYQDAEGGLSGRLVCDPTHSCANISYDLNGGKDHVVCPNVDVVVPGIGPVFVCESCLRGEHQSYGCDHRTGPEDRRDCKNLSPDGKWQCLCNPDWPELTDAIRRHNDKAQFRA